MSFPPVQASQNQVLRPLLDDDLGLLKDLVLEAAVGSLLYGIYATVTIWTFSLILSLGVFNSRARLTLCLIISFTFVVSTATQVLFIQYEVVYLDLWGLHPPEEGIEAPVLKNLNAAFNALQNLNWHGVLGFSSLETGSSE
ncbi:hypothetical protein K435DRAFT_846156 [Dendrothele bispora CBS 962.96]|uniref:Uncharacterized protein n=1 Tax=Dendrothele bispora (strain CBS 962.96) TaxID=1314807 RepID=A0A4S8KPM6_DENBC|nr:hypothetical protein K435DRAFT_846156 [Dendrothele bispora CBS 962.96]